MEAEIPVAGTQARGTEAACTDVASCVENVRNVIADALHNTAETLGHKAADLESQQIAQYAVQASEWLERSAECVRQFDYARTDARIREYVRQSPGRSMLMAGAAGLAIGVMLRRR